MEYLCTSNITVDDKLSNFSFIRSMRELYIVASDTRNHNKIIIRKDFIDDYFPYNQLSTFVSSIKKFNPNLIIETQGYEIQQEVDSDILSMISSNLTQDGLLMLLNFRHYDFIEAIFKLIKFYTEGKKFELEGASIISSLQSNIDTLNERIDELNDLLSKETINKADVQDKLSVLIKRINYTHNVGIEENMLFEISKNHFDRVIYIKEITRVQYVDTLVYALQEIFRLLYNMPTRIIVIEGYYANGKVNQYKTLKPHYRLTEQDVFSSDILMLGYQPKLFKDIMRNPSNISILIVLDRGGYKSPHLFGDNVEYLYTASDLSDVDESEKIPPSRIISYQHDTLYIPHIKEFNSLSVSEKIQRYSSLKIVKQIVELLEK